MFQFHLNNPKTSKFIETFLSLIAQHTPKIQKFIRTNNAYFMTKKFEEDNYIKNKIQKQNLNRKD